MAAAGADCTQEADSAEALRARYAAMKLQKACPAHQQPRQQQQQQVAGKQYTHASHVSCSGEQLDSQQQPCGQLNMLHCTLTDVLTWLLVADAVACLQCNRMWWACMPCMLVWDRVAHSSCWLSWMMQSATQCVSTAQQQSNAVRAWGCSSHRKGSCHSLQLCRPALFMAPTTAQRNTSHAGLVAHMANSSLHMLRSLARL